MSLAGSAVEDRRFVTDKTVVATPRAGGDLQGFDTADVKKQKMPDFVGRIEFETVPAAPVPGEPLTVKVHLVNEGKKAVRLRSVTLVATVNGVKTPSALTPFVREVGPTHRALVAELKGVWAGGGQVVEPRGRGHVRPRRDRDQPAELELTRAEC